MFSFVELCGQQPPANPSPETRWRSSARGTPGMLPDGAALLPFGGPRPASKSWIYRYRRNGRLINIGLGPFADGPAR